MANKRECQRSPGRFFMLREPLRSPPPSVCYLTDHQEATRWPMGSLTFSNNFMFRYMYVDLYTNTHTLTVITNISTRTQRPPQVGALFNETYVARGPSLNYVVDNSGDANCTVPAKSVWTLREIGASIDSFVTRLFSGFSGCLKKPIGRE